jgi:Glycosyl hydrolases family 16
VDGDRDGEQEHHRAWEDPEQDPAPNAPGSFIGWWVRWQTHARLKEPWEARMGDRILQELPGWSLAWSDEFDGAVGSPVDPASWQPQVGGNGWGNQELQCYTDSSDNARLDGAGNLQIVVRRSDPWLRDTRFGGCAYTSARLVSKDRVSLTYGLVQARIRLPRGRGLWPAFWMLGQNLDQVGWPQCGEIDVMENFGKDPTVVHGTVHGPSPATRRGILHRWLNDLGSSGQPAFKFAWVLGEVAGDVAE